MSPKNIAKSTKRPTVAAKAAKAAKSTKAAKAAVAVKTPATSKNAAVALLTPDKILTLTGWRLQTPDSAKIDHLTSFANQYFHVRTAPRETPAIGVVCRVNAAVGTPTANSAYVRSELRHMTPFSLTAPRSGQSMTFTGRVLEPTAPPTSLTIAQIHSEPSGRYQPPPLLRVYVKSASLYVAIKTDPSGEYTNHVRMESPGAYKPYSVTITNNRGHITVKINSVSRTFNATFWPHLCYFKVGCYPQTVSGYASTAIYTLQLSNL
jgi:hypothetical protein